MLLMAGSSLDLILYIYLFSCRYDREEGSTMLDADSSSLFLGGDTSFPKEAELAKRLVHICFEQLSFK